MMPAHTAFLEKQNETLTTSDGKSISVWELRIPADADLAEWVQHFRQHYCADDEIDALRAGTGLSRADYLTQLIFPDRHLALGPSIRSGDFAELLIADLVEYLWDFWVPRGKYAQKAVRDESVKGVDILGFKITPSTSPLLSDTLVAFEVKAQLSEGRYSGALQRAIDDSGKDYIRRAMTLNATKQRLHRAGKQAEVLKVQRFQNPIDFPYVYRSGAAAVLSESAVNEQLIEASTKVDGHTNEPNLELLLVRGSDLMALANLLYEKAANEA